MNDLKIRTAKPESKSYKLSDGAGMFLHVAPSGLKTWRMRYEFGGKEKTLTIGRYPEKSLSDARKERDNAKAQLQQGKDPSVEKKLDKLRIINSSLDSFERVAREWHESRLPLWTKQYGHNVLRSLERDIFPLIGQVPISDINAPIVLTALKSIENRGARETAHRVRQRISDIFVHAIATGRAETDPAAIIAPALKPVIKSRQPAIIDLAEVRKMLHKVEQEEAHPVTFLALRLLILTVVRPGELRAAQWAEFEEIEGDAPLWRIPAERMKMKREHLVPLSHQAVDVLKVLKPFSSRWPHLFPNARRPIQTMSENALGYILNRAGYHHRHVPHGFRSSFSSIMNERFQKDRYVIDVMLAHTPKDKIEGAYNRALYLERRRELAQEWANLITDGLKPLEELIRNKRKA